MLVLAITAACLLAYQVAGYPGMVPALPLLVALYTAVDAGHRKESLVTSSAAFFGGLGVSLALAEGESSREVVQRWSLLAGWLVAGKLMGEVTRHHRGYLRQVEQRALDAERTRDEVALRRAGEERLRIARELHDSLTHSISVVKMQAGVAVHLARKHGEPVPDALLAIQDASGEAMRELRSTLEVLRTDEPAAGTGLGQLSELLRRSGVPGALHISGQQRALPTAVETAAYRIIQEALTNTGRHAGPATATIRIAYGADRLTVQVDDDGTAAAGAVPQPGIGLTGMRERVTALGGQLLAGPRSEGGFTVRADLPLESAP